MFDREGKVLLERKSLLFSTFHLRGKYCEEAIKLVLNSSVSQEDRPRTPKDGEDHTDRLPDALCSCKCFLKQKTKTRHRGNFRE